MAEEWMTGARYDISPTPVTKHNGNRSTADDSGTEILGIESVYTDDSKDGMTSNHSGQARRDSKGNGMADSPQSANEIDGEGGQSDAEDEEPEDVMWKCAKCPLEFPDRDSVIAHVRAVHKKIHPAKLEEEINDEVEELVEGDADGEVAEYEIEYVNDKDHDDDNFDMPTWSPDVDNHASFPDSPKSKSSTSSSKRTRGRPSRSSDNKSSSKRGRPPKRKTASPPGYSPYTNNLSDDDYDDVNPVRVNAKKPKPWATPSLSCDICFLQVTNAESLRKHMDVFSFKPRIWKCISCPKLFMNQVESDAHFEKEHPEDKDDIVTTWSCDSCDRTFEDEYDLAHHETLHAIKAPFGCRVCGRTFEKASSLRTHENAEVNKFYGGGFKCSGCGESFLLLGELTTHQKQACKNPVALKCETCDKTYKTFESLQTHRITHTTELPWNCAKCGERFREKSDLSVHAKEEHGEDNTSACNTCGKTFGRAAALRQHELICQKYLPEDDDIEERDDPLDSNFDLDEIIADSPKPAKSHKKQKGRPSSTPKKWKCDQCGTSFGSAGLLKQHSQTHSGSKQKLFDCSYCSESFVRQNALEAHEQKKHAVNRKFGCRQCPQRFVGAAELKQHIIITHISPNGIFKCSICAKLFSKKEYLQIHSRTHLGERRFKCTQLDCEEVFYSPQARTQHLLSAHGLTEQVFKCKECGQEFEKQRELERHELTHAGDGETPTTSTVTEGKFKCSVCDKSFLEGFLLNMHKKEHEQTEYQCEHCDKKFKNIASRNIHTRKSHGDAAKKSVEEITLD